MLTAGKNAVIELLKGETTVNKVMLLKNSNDIALNRIAAMARDKKVKVMFVPKEFLDKIGNGLKHQGVLADTADFKYCEIDDILEHAEKAGRPPLVVLLDGITDPHNLGSVIRTAECAGADGIIIPRHRACLVNDTVIKTASGAAEYMNIAAVSNLNSAIDYLKKKNLFIAACDMDGEIMYRSDLTGALGIVIGSEGEGISRLTKEKCDFAVSIPLFGNISSLNASVAAGLVIYEAVRQRTGVKKQ